MTIISTLNSRFWTTFESLKKDSVRTDNVRNNHPPKRKSSGFILLCNSRLDKSVAS